MTDEKPDVLGYRAQSVEAIANVNTFKEIEERILRKLDIMTALEGVDQRWLAIGRTNLEQAFMAINRSIFRPARVAIHEDTFR